MTDDQEPVLVIELSRKDLRNVMQTIGFALENNAAVYVHVDPIDRAFKIKTSGPIALWSPPMGRVAP